MFEGHSTPQQFMFCLFIKSKGIVLSIRSAWVTYIYHYFRDGETEALFTCFSQDHSVDCESLSATYPPIETASFPIPGLLAYKMLHVRGTPSSMRITSWALPCILQAVKVKGAADVGSGRPLPVLFITL